MVHTLQTAARGRIECPSAVATTPFHLFESDSYVDWEPNVAATVERFAVKLRAAVCGRPTVGLFGGDAGADRINLRLVEEKNIRRGTLPRWDRCYPRRLHGETHLGCTRSRP